MQSLGLPVLIACIAVPYFFHHFFSMRWVTAILAAIPTLSIIVFGILPLIRVAFRGLERKSQLESERFRQHMNDLEDEGTAPGAKSMERDCKPSTKVNVTKRTDGPTKDDALPVQQSEQVKARMPYYKRAHERQCVTCNRWQGERKITQFRDRAQYHDHQDRGECVGGDWDSTKTRAITSCQKWVKWGALA